MPHPHAPRREAGFVFSRGASKFRGVGWHKTYSRWQARIKIGTQEITLWTDPNDPEVCAKAYDAAARLRDGM
jgi:hypothetical protein